MSKIPFNQLRIWVHALQLAKRIYFLTKKFPSDERYELSQQMRRAAVSIASNIAEGSKRNSDRDFAQFIAIARGSLAELETQLLLAKEIGYLDAGVTDTFVIEMSTLSKMLRVFAERLRPVR